MIKPKQIFRLSATVVLLLAISVATTSRTHNIVHAADSNFSDGITVDNSGDGADANISNSTCDDGAGHCTLRAAIEEANDTAGTQTIKFNISGAADFTIGGQNGYTIQPGSALPEITDTVIIDGYSQAGSHANTAIAPNPLNGRLLIQIDGTNAGVTNGLRFIDSSDNSTVKGLVINSFDQGDGIYLLADNILVQGNYIGIDPTGFIARPNVVGVNTISGNPDRAVDVTVGGLNAADRNLISGNTSGTTGTASYPNTGWTFQGNYIGLAADGLTPIADSTPGGSGSLSIDDCQDVTIGGSQPGAINVFGESLGHGIAPDRTSNLLIEGNYIGLGYDGTTVLGNITSGASGSGIAISNTTTALIKNNRVAGWKTGGISINSDNTDVIVEGNIVTENLQDGIGLQSSGTVVRANNISNTSGVGITAVASSNIIDSNVITGNSDKGIALSASDTTIIDNVINNNQGLANIVISSIPGLIEGNIVQGNRIGTKMDGTIDTNFSQNIGILLTGNSGNNTIGGTNAGEGNIVGGNGTVGISVTELTIIGLGTFTPNNNTIIGNSIFNSDPGALFGFPMPGLGIDHTSVTLNGFTPQSVQEDGVTLNDAGDADTGANSYLNFPVVNSTSATKGNLDVNFDLDVDDYASGYRVEFFASPTADDSGYGEGKIYLGSKDVSGSSTNAKASLTIPTSFTSGSYAITATTTEKDNSTDGFGSTSEFSAVLGSQTVLAATSPFANVGVPNTGLAKTGQDAKTPILVGVSLISGALATFLVRRRYIYNYDRR